MPVSKGDEPRFAECIRAGEDLQPYRELLINNPKIMLATSFCERPMAFQTRLWDKVKEAERTGLAPTAELPVSYLDIVEFNPADSPSVPAQAYLEWQSEQFPAEYIVQQHNQGELEERTEVLPVDVDKRITRIYVTKQEAYDIYAAHLAHSLWLEKNQIVPWSISDYSQELLEELLLPEAWFSKWDEQKEEYAFHLVLDHSPRQTFQIAMDAASPFSNQWSAMDEIIKSVRPFRHGIVVSNDSEGNPTGNNDSLNIITITAMDKAKVSRHGCQSMSPYIVQLANAINIPGRTVRGYYYNNDGHRSAIFEYTDDVLAHGDHVYHFNFLGNTPPSEVMDSYEFWKQNVLPYKGKEPGSHNSQIQEIENTMKYIATVLVRSYCSENGGGKAFLIEKFREFADEQKIDDLEKRILEISENCTTLPENNPDK